MKTRFTCGVLLTFFSIQLWGCSAKITDGPLGISQPRGIITGVLLRVGEPILTKHILRVQVKYKKDGVKKSYQALFGPDPFKVRTEEAEGAFRNPSPTWFLKSGWVFLVGDWPQIDTELITGAARGTTIIGHIDGNIHRIYLLHVSGKEECTVKIIGSQLPPRVFSAPREDMYVEYKAGDATISEALPVSGAVQTIKDFVTYATTQAANGEISGEY